MCIPNGDRKTPYFIYPPLILALFDYSLNKYKFLFDKSIWEYERRIRAALYKNAYVHCSDVVRYQ